MAGHEIFVNADVPFFYDFLLDEQVTKDPKQKETLLRLIDRKIQAAREFSNYLDSLERRTERSLPVYTPAQYQEVQKQLTKSIVDGAIFTKLNQDFNHTTYEISDTKANKARMESEVAAATKASEESKSKFHEAVADLGKKANSLDVTSLTKIVLTTDEAVLIHFNKVCAWILDVYYDTPASKFEWENFKRQVFSADKGADFKRRIQGLYIPKLYDYQIEVCQYILSTRPVFKKIFGDPNFDIILSTAEDIIKAYNARQEYTKCKKTISENKTKIIEATLDIQQSEKVSASTKPYINSIYDKLLVKETAVRSLNLSDFSSENACEHLFYRGHQGKIGTFLRGEALARYGEIEEDDKKKSAKTEKKPEKRPPTTAAPATAHTSPQIKPIKTTEVKVEFDEDVQMADVD